MVGNPRRVRSYVIRKSRMTEAQRRAYADLSSRWVVPFCDQPLNWEVLMPGTSRRIVEIGFGMGDATWPMAVNHPDWGILGIEVHRPGIGKLLSRMEEKKIGNIRIVEHDAVDVFTRMLPPAEVDGIHIWFPDPWPKSRHHKRRLIQPEFTAVLVRALRIGGYIHAATDWESYAEQILEVLEGAEGMTNRYGSWAPKPDYRPETKYERGGRGSGRVIRDVILHRENI